MDRARFGRTLIIVNPQAQSGAGAEAGERLRRFLALYLRADEFELVRTEAPGHAAELAAEARGFDTVCALGGDGTVHEVACGLMSIDREERPDLMVVPIGSGNDYARTLGIRDWRGRDFAALLSYRTQAMDVGRIRLSRNDGATETTYFVETFSFGLDAAIALDTHKLRASTGFTGNALYMASGLRVFGRGYRTFPAVASFDDEEPRALNPIVMAVQIGRTYGSGFDICPDADPTDGLLDICLAEGPYPRAAALGIFLAAKSGNHTRFKRIETRQAARVRFELAGDHPAQVDGERLRGRTLDIDVLPAALQVYRPA